MLDIGWGEMLIIAIVVIVVVGPKELPGMLRTFGKTTSKLRVMANDFRRQFDEAMKEAELDGVKKIADDVRALNPTNELKKALSPVEKAAQDVRAGLDAAMKPAARPDTSATPPAAAPQPAEPLKQAATAMPAAADASEPAAPKAKPAPAAKSAKAPAAKSAKAPAAKPAKAAAAPKAKPATAAKAKTGGAQS